MPHFWCGVRKLSAFSGLPLDLRPITAFTERGVDRWTIHQQTFASRASTGDPDTTVGGQTAYAMESTRERWYNRRYKKRAHLPDQTGRAGYNFTRLGLNIAEANFLFFFIGCQMRMRSRPVNSLSAAELFTAT